MLNDSSLLPNTAHVVFKDTKLDNVRFGKINSLPAVREHLTPKLQFNQSIDESKLVRIKNKNGFF